jgi:hypothetical protein
MQNMPDFDSDCKWGIAMIAVIPQPQTANLRELDQSITVHCSIGGWRLDCEVEFG